MALLLLVVIIVVLLLLLSKFKLLNLIASGIFCNKDPTIKIRGRVFGIQTVLGTV